MSIPTTAQPAGSPKTVTPPASGYRKPGTLDWHDWHESSESFLRETQPASTSLDPRESNVDRQQNPGFRPKIDVGTLFRHSGWAADRARVARALAADPTISPRRQQAFGLCGSDAYVEECVAGHSPESGSREWRLRCKHCKDRFCLPCSQERARRIRNSLLTHMYGLKNLSLITLTLKAENQPLAVILDRAYSHFKSLRQLPLWKQSVKGGASICECKVGQDGKRWNVHWHIVAEAKYLDQKELSRAWLTITRDSLIVDIRRVGTLGGAVSYITKYVTKSADSSVVRSERHLAEAITAFSGRRLVTTFGSWRGLQLLPKDSHEEEQRVFVEPWHSIGRLDEVYTAALNGDPIAEKILRKLFPGNPAVGPPTV